MLEGGPLAGPLDGGGAAAAHRPGHPQLEHGRLEATLDGGRAEAVVSLPILAAV